MRFTALSLLALVIAAPQVRADGKPEVNADSLKRVTFDINYLASDALEGRGVQTKGITVAADYIREEFKKMGLKSGTEDGSYFQNFDVQIREATDLSKTWMKVGTDGKDSVALKLATDFQPQQAGGSGAAKGDIVFVGYGISAEEFGYDDYAGVDVEGKVVLMIRREPQQKDDDSKFNGAETTQYSYIATKLTRAKAAGAAGVLFVNDGLTAPDADSDQLTPPAGFGGGSRAQQIPFAHITRAAANKLIAAAKVKAGDAELGDLAAIEKYIDAEFKPVSQALAGCSADFSANFEPKTVKAWNVIGVLEGEGPHADESVIIGAHYDHLGFGGYGSRKQGSSEVHNGADDNATGTAAVLELARRFAAMDKKPARRMIFIGFSGEERGLVGSRYYVDNPTVPLESIAAMLNFDMIGNLRNNQAYLGGSGTGTGLQEVAEAANSAVPVDVRISSGTGGGSDHLPFAMKRVPVLFCNTGLTDLYHTPEDDAATINMPGAVLVIDFCVELLKGVTALEEKPTFQNMRSRRGPRRPRVTIGFQPATDSAETGGVVVRSVTKDSPADKAGLKVGDIVTAISDKEIKTRVDISGALRGKRPGDKVQLQITREGEKKELEVTLGGR